MAGNSEILPGLSVSRETLEKLEIYHALIEKWTQKINLIAKSTQKEIWSRHILDSAQIFLMIDGQPERIADFGSGGGMPAIVLSVLSQESFPQRKFILIESDSRKVAFLREVRRELDLECEIINDRIENVPPLNADVITARAFASLTDLLVASLPHIKPTGQLIFPKGRQVEAEISMAKRDWRFCLHRHQSYISDESVILNLKDLARES